MVTLSQLLLCLPSLLTSPGAVPANVQAIPQVRWRYVRGKCGTEFLIFVQEANSILVNHVAYMFILICNYLRSLRTDYVEGVEQEY